MDEPTNSDIIKQLKILHADFKGLDQRVILLEQWKIAYDAADAALTRYKQEHPEHNVTNMAMAQTNPLSEGVDKAFIKLLTAIVAVLSTLAGVIYLAAQKFFQ